MTSRAGTDSVVWTLLFLVQAAPAAAESNLRMEMAEAAMAIAELAATHKTSEVELGEVAFRTSDSKLYSAAGAGIVQVLAEELRKQKIGVAPGAKLRIQGKYVDVIDMQSKLLAAKVDLEISDGSGRALKTITRGVFGDAALSALFGTNLDLPPRGELAQRDKRLVQAVDSPAVTIDRALVRPDKATPYGVEVLVLAKDRYEPRAATAVDGQAFVRLGKDDVFAIRLSNASEHEAVVYLAIDGIPLFTFSEVQGYSQVIVGPKSSAVVEGWFRGTRPLFDRFRPGAYPASEVLKSIPRAKGPGVITAVFSGSYALDAAPPEDEPLRPFSRSVAVDSHGKELILSNRRLEVEPAPAKDPPPNSGGPGNVNRPEKANPFGGEPADDVLTPAPGFGDRSAVSADFRSRLEEHPRTFGVVRTAITVRFDK